MQYERLDGNTFYCLELSCVHNDIKLYYQLEDLIRDDGYTTNIELDIMQFNKVDHVIIDHVDKKIQIDIRR